MNNHLAKCLCVSIPHAGLACPPEIDPRTFSEQFEEIKLQSVDFYADHLYDFQNILENQQVIFPYLPFVINVNRHPDVIDESAPLKVDELHIFKKGREPTIEFRKQMIRLYHYDYHKQLACIPKKLILDGHSVTESDFGNERETPMEDILIEDYQASPLDPEVGIKTAPKGYAETYIEELQKRLPSDFTISLNTKYVSTYGHVLAFHGWDGIVPRYGRRVPVLLQETNERLYIGNRHQLLDNLDFLRKAFADALLATIVKMDKIYGSLL